MQAVEVLKRYCIERFRETTEARQADRGLSRRQRVMNRFLRSSALKIIHHVVAKDGKGVGIEDVEDLFNF
jgi:hypothetical protein